ncbi:DNA-directed RNA polymerase subunit alpha [Candidatus Woesebacteria bacterium]|nr:DNA-directed RNA polymerase subunit alpha [Candidatus Woesebacteria bacterium]
MNEPIFGIKEEEKGKNYVKFIISPLTAGYGHTLGNSLRRILLTSLPGAAITKIRIAGVKHQFSTLKGMKEDVVDFLLNLKKVRISYSGEKPIKLTLSVSNQKEVAAAEIKVPANAKIANPELPLASLAKGAKLEAEMEAEVGVGYSPSEERITGKIGVIPIDAIFSPVQRVNYKVEETRVGRLTNYDKLSLQVWTDGTITPRDALVSSAKILDSYLNQIISPKRVKLEPSIKIDDSLGGVAKLSVEEIGLPTRVANALIKAGYETVESLVNAKKEDLIRVRNLGDKSLKIIKLALLEKGVGFKDA